MKEGWKYRKLGEIGKISSGKAISSTKIHENGLYPCYGGNGLRGYTEDYIYDGLYPIIGRVGALCGNVHLANGKFYPTEHALVISLKGKESPYFIEYLLKSLNLNQYAKGVAQPVLSASTLSDIMVSVPPIAEQERIVAELDLLTGIIDKQKAQLKELDTLAQSIFYDEFGDPVENGKKWEVKKLDCIAEFKNGLNFSKLENGYTYRFLGVSDFQDNSHMHSSSLKTISLTNKLADEYLLDEGDIVFVRSNGSKELIGRSLIMHISEPTTFSGFCIRCRLTNNCILSIFLSSLLKSPTMRPLITNSGRGCNISNLNQKTLGAVPIILPPLPQQQSFAAKIESIELQKSTITRSLTESQKLFDYTMDKYFG